MESGSISPEEFRKLKIQVDILQKFLIKTFGSSFVEFCKEAQSTLAKESKPPPTLYKVQAVSTPAKQSNGNIKVKSLISLNGNANGTNRVTAASTANRRPPPLLHRPNSTAVKAEQKPSTSTSVSYQKSSVVIESGNGGSVDQTEYYDETNEEDVVQFIQPEAVFSDDEHQGSKVPPLKKLSPSTSGRNGVKREHAEAFGYEAEEQEQSEMAEMNLPEGTECIVIDSEEYEGQGENFMYKQEDEEYFDDDGTNEELYDEDGYSYSMAEDGLEVTTGETNTENYQAEELKTDGNVTFGTVYTDTNGMQYFQCTFCPSAKVFKHKQSLKEHYLLNHSPTSPPFQCQCGRRFLKQSQLKRHEVVHTAERPYVCPICLKDFTRKDNMTVHMVRNHAEKKHPCPYCPDKVYATPAEVNRHLRMYHSQWQQ